MTNRLSKIYNQYKNKNSGLRDLQISHGSWDIECYAPYKILDIEKFDNIFNCSFRKNNILTHKNLNRIKKIFPLYILDELEILLYSGGSKWKDSWQNLVVNTGLDYALDVSLSGGTQITTWYIGLIDGSSPTIVAGDTMASHAGWTENENYSESVRQTWVDGGVSSQTVNNFASKAEFTIDTNAQTFGGGFLVSNDTKGGTTGTLYSAGALSLVKTGDDGDTLNVSASFSSEAS